MKKLLLLIIFIISNISYTQIAPTMEVLRKPTFRGDIRQFSYTGTTLYVAGYDLGIRSFVAKSTDLGANWQILAEDIFPSGDNLNGISFFGNTGIVVGSTGKMYRSTNGGANWTDISNTALYAGGFNDVQLLNASTGYACGANDNSKQILKTVDGGATWTALTTGQTNTDYDMWWDNETTGWVVGSGGRIIRTTNGGDSWTQSTTSVTSTLYSIRRASANVFYACGTSGSFIKSEDGGQTFITKTAPTTSPLYTIEIISENEVLVLGSAGIVYKTTDGGNTWTTVTPFTTEVIRTSIKIGNKIIAGCYKSTVAESVDGVNWNILTNDNRDLYGIYQEGNRIVAVGDRGGVHLSENNGLSWTKKTYLQGNIMYDAYVSGDNIYVCGRAGNYFVSTDAGNTWLNKSIGTSTTRLYKLYFFNSNIGYTVTNEGTILYTTDKGFNWVTQASFTTTTLYDIKMLNTTTGFASGSGERLFSTTNGSNWSHGTLAQPSGQMTGIYPVDQNNGYVCGENGAIYKTSDGFNTLTLISDTIALAGKVVHDVLYFAPGEVWAVAQGGLVLRMNQQGQMVVVANSLYGEDLTAMYKSGPNSFIVSGYSGTVYRFSFNPVPVELTSFTLSSSGNSVLLEWATATELNTKEFEIERKTGNEWQTIGSVKAVGNSTQANHYSYTDADLNAGKYLYRLKIVDFDGTIHYSQVTETAVGLPKNYFLGQNYPNPFGMATDSGNPSTLITYQLPVGGLVRMKLYDILGNEVATLVNETKNAGFHSVVFSSGKLANGIYVYKIEAGQFVDSKKLVLMK